jgi:hypothetical protein
MIPVELELRHWPLRDDPWRIWPSVALMLFVGIAGLLVSSTPHLGLLASLLVAATIWRDFLRATYQLDPQCITELTFFGRRRTSWSAVRRLEITPTGVRLLPTAERSPLARVHSRFVPWCGERERVLELLDRYAHHAHRVERTSAVAR